MSFNPPPYRTISKRTDTTPKKARPTTSVAIGAAADAWTDYKRRKPAR